MVQETDATSDGEGCAEDRLRHEVKVTAKPEPKRVSVRLVQQQGQSVVVEVKTKTDWYRAIVPSLSLGADNTVAEDDLKAGRYGEDWASMVEAKDFPRRLAEELHVQGIFSFAELRQFPARARAAISAAHGCTLASLLSKEK